MTELAQPKRTRNVRGKSGDPVRDAWCTAEPLAKAIGPVKVDPFSNPHSHIIAEHACMLEDGGDGFGGGRPGLGAYKVGGKYPLFRIAEANDLTFIQPGYSFTMRALHHYQHTRFIALLRFDPRVDWFKWLYARVQAVRVLWSAEFEPPPGVSASSNSFPHALYYRDARDVTDAVRALTFGWTKPRKD